MVERRRSHIENNETGVMIRSDSNIQNEIAEKQKTLDKYSKMQGDINIALKYIDDKISE